MSEQKDESVSAWGEVPEAAKLIETGREPASELQRRRSIQKSRNNSFVFSRSFLVQNCDKSDVC